MLHQSVTVIGCSTAALVVGGQDVESVINYCNIDVESCLLSR